MREKLINQTTYYLDKGDKILSVGSGWNQFASENDGEQLVAAKVEGRSIWDFISGDITKVWFRTIIQLADLHQEAVEHPYRCDSPTLKRYMKMRVSKENNILRVDHSLLRVERREKPVLIRHASEFDIFSQAMRCCSLCGRIHRGREWYEPDDAIFDSEGSQTFFVIYVVCETCQLLMPMGVD